VYAVPKSKVNGDYYETHQDTNDLINTFNEHIEMIHIESLEAQALQVVCAWEQQQK
jgi:hypothetical protein